MLNAGSARMISSSDWARAMLAVPSATTLAAAMATVRLIISRIRW
jgi:hypothetical protein